MRALQQSTSTYHIPIYLVLNTDHLTPATGKTVTVYLSKNLASGVSASGAITEPDSTNLKGIYKLAGNTTDSNTLGSLMIYATASGCDPYIVEYSIVAYDPYALTRDANVTQWKGTTAATVDTAGYPKVTIKDGSGAGEIQLTSGKIDEVTLVDSLAANTLTSTAIQDGAFTVAKFDPAATTATDLVDSFYDEPRADHTIAGTVGAGYSRILNGTITGTPTTTTFSASAFVSTHDDQFNNTRSIVFTSGTLIHLRTAIRDYVNSTRTFTFDAVHTAPTAGDTFELN